MLLLCRPEPLLKGVYNMKFAKPSKIQSVALPLILAEYVVFIHRASRGKERNAVNYYFFDEMIYHFLAAVHPRTLLVRHKVAAVKLLLLRWGCYTEWM